MKARGLYIYCAVLTAALIIVASAALVSKEWFDTEFRSVPEISATTEEGSFILPLIEHTAVKYKTSDSSYVLVSRGDLKDIANFYTVNKYETERVSDGKLKVTANGAVFNIERFSDDTDYIIYLVEAIG